MLPNAEELVSGLLKQIKPLIHKNTALIGIHTGGAWLAQRLCKDLPKSLPLGLLDISFYRDDFSHAGLHPQIRRSEISFDVEGKDILLIDDVLYTGRTVRAAMNELFDYGRPASIKLVVLVDRGGRELPIEAQYIGAKLDLNKGQNVQLNQDSSGKFTLTLHDVESKHS
jgi:pyrimidine operon attenuation protein/uracil phosphoribosyltransferase